MKQNVATTLGFLIAPLVAAAALPFVEVVEGNLGFSDTETFGWVFIFYCYSLSVTLIIALPIFLLLNRFGNVTWWSAILTGAFSSAVMALVFDSLNFHIIVPVGGLSAFVFWLVWRLGGRSHEDREIQT